MARLNLDLIQPPRAHLLSWLLLAVASAGVGAALLQRTQLLDDIAALQSQQARAEHRLRGQTLVPGAPAASPAALVAVDRIAHELTLPWTGVWDNLRRLTPVTIEIDKLQPDLATGQLQVQGRAADHQAFLAYLGALARDTHWQDVQPVSEELDTTRADKPLRFQLRARWRSSL